MTIISETCPLCGQTITIDDSLEHDGVIKIRTKRRSTVLVHKDCYIKALGVHYDIQSHFN